MIALVSPCVLRIKGNKLVHGKFSFFIFFIYAFNVPFLFFFFLLVGV